MSKQIFSDDVFVLSQYDKDFFGYNKGFQVKFLIRKKIENDNRKFKDRLYYSIDNDRIYYAVVDDYNGEMPQQSLLSSLEASKSGSCILIEDSLAWQYLGYRNRDPYDDFFVYPHQIPETTSRIWYVFDGLEQYLKFLKNKDSKTDRLTLSGVTQGLKYEAMQSLDDFLKINGYVISSVGTGVNAEGENDNIVTLETLINLQNKHNEKIVELMEDSDFQK